jgi:splicing factor 1
MAWRQQGSTGSNNIPLGNRRRFGGDSASPQRDDGGYNPTQPSSGISEGGFKRGRSRSPRRGESPISHKLRSRTNASLADEPAGDGNRRRKKRNRWGDATENKAAGLMGLPTAIMANMTSEQLEAYTLHLRIEEISQKLRIDDVVPADGDRCLFLPNLRNHKTNNSLDPHLLLLNTITLVAVSTLENTDTESVSKMSGIN